MVASGQQRMPLRQEDQRFTVQASLHIYIYLYITTKILEIRLADIPSLLVKDVVRATDKAARAVTIYTLIGNVRRSTVKIRAHVGGYNRYNIRTK